MVVVPSCTVAVGECFEANVTVRGDVVVTGLNKSSLSKYNFLNENLLYGQHSRL